MSRPNSETDFGDPDEENAKIVESMNESEVNMKIEELIVSARHRIWIKTEFLDYVCIGLTNIT